MIFRFADPWYLALLAVLPLLMWWHLRPGGRKRERPALAGTDQFKGHKTNNWVVAARMVPLPVGVLVRKSSPFQTMADLKGKRFTVGYTAQKTVRFVLNAFLWNAGMTEKDVDGVRVPNTTAGAQLFLKGQVDGSLSSLGGARLRNADAKRHADRPSNVSSR